MKVKRNVLLSYILAGLFNAHFWMGIWLLYYLRFTNYAGVGLLESVWLVISLFGEVPTGAIADMLGKKKTLIVSFFFTALGYLIMGLAPSFSVLFFSLIVMAIGGVLQSGTYEAIIYDTLKQLKQVKIYDKVLANTQTIGLVSIAISSIIGGFVYRLSPGMPFVMTSIAIFLAMILSFWLVEPKIDTAKFSLRNYLNQTRQGFNLLFTKKRLQTTLIFLTIAAFFTILYQSVNDALVIEFGFKGTQLGVFYAGIFIVSALGVQLTPWLKRYLKPYQIITIIGVVFSATLMISPFVMMFVGGLTVYLRETFGQILINLTSNEVNRDIPSKFRATTLSTFSMLKSLPYMFFAILIGHLMDLYTARVFAFWFGLAFGVIILVQFLLYQRTIKKS